MTQIHFDRWQQFFFSPSVESFEWKSKVSFTLHRQRQQIVYISGYLIWNRFKWQLVINSHQLHILLLIGIQFHTFLCREHFNLLCLNKRNEFSNNSAATTFIVKRDSHQPKWLLLLYKSVFNIILTIHKSSIFHFPSNEFFLL